MGLTKHSVGVLSNGDVGGGWVGKVVRSRLSQVCQWHSFLFSSFRVSFWSVEVLPTGPRPCLSLTHDSHFSSGHLMLLNVTTSLYTFGLEKKHLHVFSCFRNHLFRYRSAGGSWPVCLPLCLLYCRYLKHCCQDVSLECFKENVWLFNTQYKNMRGPLNPLYAFATKEAKITPSNLQRCHSIPIFWPKGGKIHLLFTV